MTGVQPGARSDTWIDWDLHGHQVVTYLTAEGRRAAWNGVDVHQVPVPHFGMILTVPILHELAARLRDADTAFVTKPYLRFKGEVGEPSRMGVYDLGANKGWFQILSRSTSNNASPVRYPTVNERVKGGHRGQHGGQSCHP